MSSQLTSQTVLSAIQKWKPVDPPTIPSGMSTSEKKERKDAYAAYKRTFTTDRSRIKNIVRDIFSTGGPANQQWNYRSSGFPRAGGSWNGVWPKMGKLGPSYIQFDGRFEDVKKIIESYEGDRSNDYIIDNIGRPTKRGQRGKLSIEFRIKGDVDIDEYGTPVTPKEYPIRFASVGEGTFVGDASSATQMGIKPTILTDVQEMGSAWIFKNAYERGKSFDSIREIKGDKIVYNELDKIWGTVSGNPNFTIKGSDGDKWLLSFVGQNRKLLQKIKSGNWSVLTMGSPKHGYQNAYSDWYSKQDKFSENFMDWIGKKVKIFQISDQNNWNPADVWLIKDEAKVREKIEFALKNPVKAGSLKQGAIRANLSQMNAIFRDLFTKQEIIGISLKKVEKHTATWKLVNVSQKFFKKMEVMEFPVNRIECKLGTKAGNPGYLETQDTNVFLRGSKDGDEKFVIQIKATDTRKFDNLKFEPKDLKNPGARMGKATASYVDEMTTDQVPGAQSWKRRWQDFPRANQQFNAKGQPIRANDVFDEAAQTEYKKIIKDVYSKSKKHGIDIDMGDIPTPNTNAGQDQAIQNLIDQFETKPHIANNKLMQLKWLSLVLDITTTKDLTQFWTDIIFLAEKAGSQYGPYGKLY